MATKQEIAADAMIAMARDGNIGYSQGTARTGLRGHTPAEVRAGLVADTDCSFSVAWANVVAGLLPESVLWGTIWTGNMVSVYTTYGASALAWDSVGLGGLKIGDTVLSNGHTAMYVGNGYMAEASLNEFGDILGGKLGDQTGGETFVSPARRGKWHTVLRFPVTSATTALTEEDELMAAKDDIIAEIRDLKKQLNEVRRQLHYDVGRAQTMTKNVSDGLAYQNTVYLDPTKQAVARIDKKTK